MANLHKIIAEEKQQLRRIEEDIANCERCKRQKVISRLRMCPEHMEPYEDLIERMIDR